MNSPTLQVSKLLTDRASLVEGFFGLSSGTTVSERIEFQDFEGELYRVAIATEKPFLFASLFFIEKEIQWGDKKQIVWININSFRKRFSVVSDKEAAKFLMQHLPEKLIPGLKTHLSFSTNPSNSTSSSSDPLLINLPFPMGQRPVLSITNPSNPTTNLDTLIPFTSPRNHRHGFTTTPPIWSKEASSSFYVSDPSSSITPLRDQDRVDRIQRTIHQYSSTSKVSNIAQCCSLADKKASELPPATTTAIIAGKDHSLDRSILIGPQENGRRKKFLLLTHVQTGNDPQLGKGSYKKAKFAVDLDSGQIKVVTIAKKSNLRNPSRWNFAKEILSHELKNTIQAGTHNSDLVHVDFGHQSNEIIDYQNSKEEKHYFIMDYCDNGDLSKKKLESNNLQQHQWTLEIARGLATMHQEGILHRDVKPENIFLQEGHAKIGDLGFACTTKEAESNGRPGTPAYLAPECLTGNQTSIKSDAWSFGCLVFELLGKTKERLCKHNAMQFQGQQRWVDQRIEEHIPDPKHRELLKGLLTLDPQKRMTIQEFYEKFSEIPTPA